MGNTSEKLEFLAKLFKAGAVLGRKFSGQGLTFPYFVALYSIYQAPGQSTSLTDLENLIGLPRMGVDKLIRDLEKLGAVTSAPKSPVVLTDKGRELFENAKQLAELRLADTFPSESDNEMRAINKFLENLH